MFSVGVALKFAPDMVTAVPIGPDAGLKELICGRTAWPVLVRDAALRTATNIKMSFTSEVLVNVVMDLFVVGACNECAGSVEVFMLFTLVSENPCGYVQKSF